MWIITSRSNGGMCDKMAGNVRYSCPNPECGEQRLPADRFTIRMQRFGEVGAVSQYRVRCDCGLIVLKDALSGTAMALLDAGAKKELWEWPLEIMSRPLPDDGTLGLDDLIDLGLAIEEGDEVLFNKITRPRDDKV